MSTTVAEAGRVGQNRQNKG